MKRKLSLWAETGRGGLSAAVSWLPLTSRRGGRCALFPSLHGENSSRQTGEVRVSVGVSLRRGEAALHCGAVSWTTLLAEHPIKQSQELFSHAAMHVAINVRMKAALQEEEHKGSGGQPRGHIDSGVHRNGIQNAVGTHTEDIWSHDDKHYTSCLAVVVEPSVFNSNRVSSGCVGALRWTCLLG